jgi:putative flippase GtrA
MPKRFSRFFKYSSVGVSTFLFDLALLFILIDWFKINYVLSTGVAFMVAVSLNYQVSRRFVFPGTLRSAHAGYAIFLLITAAGMLAVMGLMSIFVGQMHWQYLPARIFVAGVVGFWNYLMNLYVNFKVTEHE